MGAADFTRWRLDAGLSQQEVADALGVTKGAVSHWETGRHPISRRTVAALHRWAADKKLAPP